MSNEEFDNLKEELLWQGSKVAVLRYFALNRHRDRLLAGTVLPMHLLPLCFMQSTSICHLCALVDA